MTGQLPDARSSPPWPDDLVDRLGPVGLGWHPDGHAWYRGPLLELLSECDRALRHLAGHWRAVDEHHPVALPAEAADRGGYLSSFPQLVTFTAPLADDDANLHALRSAASLGADGALRGARLAAPREVLTPAACYPVYLGHEGEALDGPVVITNRSTCARRERRYEPLRRQHSFEVREIVCLGPRPAVVAFLDQVATLVDALVRRLDLPAVWQAATDPFFTPRDDPRFLFQRVHGTKRELVYDGDLAISSVNLHEDHFGAAFGITNDGAPATSGCVGFGLDRWLFAVTDRHGPDPARWPDLHEAARQARNDVRLRWPPDDPARGLAGARTVAGLETGGRGRRSPEP